MRKSFFAYIQVSTQNVSQLWKRIYASSSFWVENRIYPEPSVLHEQSSDGLEIVVAVWGMIRATKNPILKISPQNFSKPVPRKVQTNETQLEFHISKTSYFSIYTSLNSKYSKHTLLQCFFLNWISVETHENRFNERKQQDDIVSLLGSLKSTAKKRFFCCFL